MPAETVKVADDAPAATVTVEGLVKAELVSEIATEAPPAGAAAVKVTVQEALDPEARLVGVHCRVDTREVVVFVVCEELKTTSTQ